MKTRLMSQAWHRPCGTWAPEAGSLTATGRGLSCPLSAALRCPHATGPFPSPAPTEGASQLSLPSTARLAQPLFTGERAQSLPISRPRECSRSLIQGPLLTQGPGASWERPAGTRRALQGAVRAPPCPGGSSLSASWGQAAPPGGLREPTLA